MPHFAVVVDDPAKHHAAEIERSIHVHLDLLTADRPNMGQAEAARLRRLVDASVREHVGPPKPVGFLQTVCSTDCPDGLPNCRNCGDPAFAASCAAAGHCPYCCSLAHGMAPDSYLALSGQSLVPLAAPPTADEAWDPALRRFVPRAPQP